MWTFKNADLGCVIIITVLYCVAKHCLYCVLPSLGLCLTSFWNYYLVHYYTSSNWSSLLLQGVHLNVSKVIHTLKFALRKFCSCSVSLLVVKTGPFYWDVSIDMFQIKKKDKRDTGDQSPFSAEQTSWIILKFGGMKNITTVKRVFNTRTNPGKCPPKMPSRGYSTGLTNPA